MTARLRPGRDVKVLDLSSGGALVETAARLLPGTSIVLHLVGIRGPHTVRGTVLRCYVSALDRLAGIRYRAALGFDQAFQMPDNTIGAPEPGPGRERHAFHVRQERVVDSLRQGERSLAPGS